MQRINNKYSLEFFSCKIENVLSSNSTNKDDELHDIANEMRQRAAKEDGVQKLQRMFFLLVLVAFTFSMMGNLLMMDRNDVLNEQIATKVEALEYRDSILMQIMVPNSKDAIIYRVKNGNPLTYRQLLNENDSLERKCRDIECSKEYYRKRLELIINNYPITFTQEGNTQIINAPQIDSALLLLPLYRDMIEYDKKSNSWITTRIKYGGDK